jgi:hypothetical protein
MPDVIFQASVGLSRVGPLSVLRSIVEEKEKRSVVVSTRRRHLSPDEHATRRAKRTRPA